MAKAKANKKANNVTKGVDVKALEEAKKKFEEAQRKFAEQKAEVTKAKRIINTADRKIATLEKKAQEELEKPNKAVEILLKKAEEMEEKAKALEVEQEQILTEAKEKEEAIKEAEDEFAAAKEEAEKKMEELGIKGAARKASAATGTAAERRAKNNFQYRLKSNGWLLEYNLKGRITQASKYGLTVVFDSEEYEVTGGTLTEPFRHTYGQNSLSALSQVIKDHGEPEEEEEEKKAS